jgi:hypothetical protein
MRDLLGLNPKKQRVPGRKNFAEDASDLDFAADPAPEKPKST